MSTTVTVTVQDCAAAPPPLARIAIDVAALGANTIIAGMAGKIIRVHGFDFSLAATTTLQLMSGATPLSGPMSLDAWSKPLLERAYFECGVGEDLVIALGAAVQCGGVIWYRQD